MTDGNMTDTATLPTNSQPPLIMPFGKPAMESKLINLDVRIFGDIKVLNSKNLLKKYDKIMHYLTSIFPNAQNKKNLDLIWLPVEKSLGHIGGAAGHSSFIANYLVEAGKWTEESNKWLLKISAHESVHIISNLNLPLWGEESLAEYYAFKVISKVEQTNTNPLQDFVENKSKIPHSNSSLYYAGKQLTGNNKDMSYYPLIYLKGAAFWYELDMALQNKGKNLDTYIRKLSKVTFTDGKLSEEFESALKLEISAPVWKKIKQKYLLD